MVLAIPIITGCDNLTQRDAAWIYDLRNFPRYMEEARKENLAKTNRISENVNTNGFKLYCTEGLTNNYILNFKKN